MSQVEDPAARLAELERQVEELRGERAHALAEGAMLKALLDDMAKRRDVEQRLRQTQEWLHLAQEAGGVAAYTFDFATGRLDWSPSTLALYGFGPGQEPTLETWLDSIHPEDRAGARAVAEAALQRGCDVDHRFRIIRPDGSVSWVQDRGRIRLDDQGRPQRLVGINVDVTELVELQRLTAENEERLRLALQAGKQACWDWDVVTGQVRWDENLARYAGLSTEFGGSFDEFLALVHADDRERVLEAIDRSLSGGQDYAIEFRMTRADGVVRWTSTSAVVVRGSDGRALRMVGIDADITERKRMESSLREQERFLQSVLDASADCIKVIESSGSLTYMNYNGQCAMEIDDFSGVAGRKWDELWPQESAPLVRRAVQQANAGLPSRFEAFCPTAGGTPKWWEVSVAPIRSDEGDVVRIVSVSRDVTDRHQKEDQLRLLNAELHHRVKNNMAMVQALARASSRSADSVESFERSFSARLQGLAKTYDLLKADSDAAGVAELIRTELEPFGRAAHLIRLEGPTVLLPAAQAVSFGMAVHELATNAAKYGSLSLPEGALTVIWRTEESGPRPVLVLEWTESGGPEAPEPARSGFGSKLIERLVGQLRGRVERR